MLWRRVEEIRRMTHHELIDWRARRHEHCRRSGASSSGAPRPLPRSGDRARISGQHTYVECADVDAELECVGRDDRLDDSVPQLLFDLAPPLREVPATVSPDSLARPGRSVEIVLQIRRQDFCGQSALGEDDELHSALQEFAGHTPGLRQVRASDPELLVDDGRVHEQEGLLAARRPVLGDQLEGLLHEPFGQLARVRDRCRAADEGGIRAVVRTDPPQPPQDVRQVAAEHPSIHVQLVDDDVAEVLEQLGPARMVRQDPRVQHVGIAQHDMRAAANGFAGILRCIAVVGEHADLRNLIARQPLGQTVQLGELILRERLRRKQIQGPRGRIPDDGVEHGDVVAERLAGGGGSGDHHVAARERMLDGDRLVGIELLDAARLEHPAERLVDSLRERRVPCRKRREHARRSDPTVRPILVRRAATDQAIQDRLQRGVARRIGSPDDLFSELSSGLAPARCRGAAPSVVEGSRRPDPSTTSRSPRAQPRGEDPSEGGSMAHDDKRNKGEGPQISGPLGRVSTTKHTKISPREWFRSRFVLTGTAVKKWTDGSIGHGRDGATKCDLRDLRGFRATEGMMTTSASARSRRSLSAA